MSFGGRHELSQTQLHLAFFFNMGAGSVIGIVIYRTNSNGERNWFRFWKHFLCFTCFLNINDVFFVLFFK